MRWIKHMTATRQDEKIAAYLELCGSKDRHEGYGFYWSLIEVVASAIEKGSQKSSATYPLTSWSRLLYCHHHTVSKYIGKLEVTLLVTPTWEDGKLTVDIPNILKYRDEYTRKSGVRPASVPAKKQIQNTDSDSDPQAPERAFAALYEKHPRKTKRYLAETAVAAIFAPLVGTDRTRTASEIVTVHAAWCDSEEWTKESGRFAPALDRWLTEQRWKDGLPPKAADEWAN